MQSETENELREKVYAFDKKDMPVQVNELNYLKENFEHLSKAHHLNLVLLWFGTTMAVIAAINSLLNNQILRWLVFLMVSLISLFKFYHL